MENEEFDFLAEMMGTLNEELGIDVPSEAGDEPGGVDLDGDLNFSEDEATGEDDEDVEVEIDEELTPSGREDEDDDKREEEDEEDEIDVPEDEERENDYEIPGKNRQSAKDRIGQLIKQRNEARQQAEDFKKQLEYATHQAATATEAHPDPEAELKDLNERYRTIKTPKQIVDEGIINPLTGYEYTPAEAEAAIANLKQDIQFQISDANNAVVARMNQSREAERLGSELSAELSALIHEMPELDRDSKKANPDLCDMLQAIIDTNAKTDRGILTGWNKEPKEFIGTFKRVVKSLSMVKANSNKSVKKKIDLAPGRNSVNDQFTEVGNIEDDLLKAFADSIAGN